MNAAGARLGLDGLRHPGALQPRGRNAVCHQVGRLQGQARSGSHARPESEILEGGSALEGAGIRFEHGLMEAEARELNIGFVSRMTRGRLPAPPEDRGDARRPQRPSGRAIAVDHWCGARAATATAGARALALC